MTESTFGDLVALVRLHSDLLVLSDAFDEASIAVWPAMRGRLRTSTASGSEGLSFGWVNHELMASAQIQQHMNAMEGENRLWLGPEGGQFSICFALCVRLGKFRTIHAITK